MARSSPRHTPACGMKEAAFGMAKEIAFASWVYAPG
jgi:hypothetical protein